jgi:pimeloyl-ACP methyl ester carboxylesterase
MANLPRRTTSANAVAPIIAATGALAGVGLVLAWIAYSRTRIQHNLPLTAALDGDLQFVTTPSAGELAYYAAGPSPRGKPPVLLVHSVNAAASSFEMKPLFDRLSKHRRVIALDLPGFGFSSRADRDYTPRLMRDAIADVIRLVLRNGPVDVIALSLGAEFVALAAQAHPALFRTVSFISPTGFGPRAVAMKAKPATLRALKLPLWRRPLFDLLTSRPSLRFFTKRSARKRLPRAFTDYAYAASHQPGSENAPFAFLSGKLFTHFRDVCRPATA